MSIASVVYLKEAILTRKCAGGQLRLHHQFRKEFGTTWKSAESGVLGTRRRETAENTYKTLSHVHRFDSIMDIVPAINSS